jgi:thioredoxin-like negative regulator of GroEL
MYRVLTWVISLIALVALLVISVSLPNLNLVDKTAQAETSSNIVEATDANVDQKIADASKANMPVFALVYATNNSTSLSEMPIFEQLAQQFSGQATFGRTAIDKNWKIAGALPPFSVNNVPIFLVLKIDSHKQISVLSTHAGYLDKNAMEGFVKNGIKQYQASNHPWWWH